MCQAGISLAPAEEAEKIATKDATKAPQTAIKANFSKYFDDIGCPHAHLATDIASLNDKEPRRIPIIKPRARERNPQRLHL